MRALRLAATGVLACFATSAWPQPAPKVDTAKFVSAMRAGKKIEASWEGGVSLIEFRVLVRDFSAEVKLLEGLDGNVAERDFLNAAKGAGAVLGMGTSVWQASIGETARGAAEATCVKFGTENAAWGQDGRYLPILRLGMDLLTAAGSIYAGNHAAGRQAYEDAMRAIEERPRVAQQERDAAKVRAARDAVEAEARRRPLTEDELASFRGRLENQSSNARVLATYDLVKRNGTGLTPLLPLLIAGLHDPDWNVRIGMLDVLKSMGAEASSAIPAIREAAADPSLRIGMTGASVIEKITAAEAAAKAAAEARK